MKPILSWLILAGGILIGGVLGWTLKPEPATTPQRAASNERQRPARSFTAGTSRFASEIKSINASTFKINARDPAQDLNYLEGLASALIKKAGGYDGLQGAESQAFQQVLDAMAKRDLERALTWIDQFSEPKSRVSLYGTAIRSAMKDAPVRERLEFFKSRGFTAEEIGSYAGHLMLGYESMSTETALHLLSHVQPSDGGYSGGHSRFNADFDFAHFANTTLEMSRANGNKPPNVYPMNFFSEWTRSDPQAAAAFYFTHCTGKDGLKLPYQKLDSFMKELHANIPEADYRHFLSTAIRQQLVAESPDKQLLDELLRAGLSTSASMAETLASLPDPAARQRLITDAVSRAAEASASQGGDLMQLRGALSLMQDPGERLDSVESYARELSQREGDREAARMIHNLCNQLSILGHLEADLQRVRSAAGRYGP